jgi:hypothetical protein
MAVFSPAQGVSLNKGHFILSLSQLAEDAQL